jgi:diguanylate cyclase (GGDEF)-like protein
LGSFEPWENSVSTLLIIDDCDADRAQTSDVVGASGLFDEVIQASDGIKGLRVLLEKSVDVVVCRFEMRGLDGAKLLPTLRAHPAGTAVPLIFLTPDDDAERRARIIEGGASEVLTMPVHPAELVARLRLHLRSKRLQDDLRIKNETLGRLSTLDGLTGLRTRRYVDDFLAIEFLRARRYGNTLTVMMGDLDHFKRVNDEHGHLAGDAALRGVAAILLHDLRKTDVAGRYGGEEILVVLAQSESSGARILADRWRLAVEEACFADASGNPVHVTLSIGIAMLSAEMESPESLVGAADAALYRAKSTGRNRVVVAGPSGTFHD